MFTINYVIRKSLKIDVIEVSFESKTFFSHCPTLLFSHPS